MINQLPDEVVTMQDLKAVILEIREYAKWYSQYSVKTRVAGASHDQPVPASGVATSLLQKWAADNPTQQGLDQLLADLTTLETKSPHITITLAANAPGDLKTKMVAWCRKNISPNILVSFRFNSTLLGGMVVQHGSHVYDWSFRRQILNSQAKFAEVLRRVR